MLYFRRIIWYIIFVLSFFHKKICYDSKITLKSFYFFLCQPCDLKHLHTVVIYKLIQSFRYFHQRFNIFLAVPVSVRPKIQYNCHHRKNLFPFFQQLAAVRCPIISYYAKRHIFLHNALILNTANRKLYFFFFPVLCYVSFQLMYFFIFRFVL